jgi:hypothetical protein
MSEKVWGLFSLVLILIICTQAALGATRLADGSIVLSAEEAQQIQQVFGSMIARIELLEEQAKGNGCI